MILPPHSLCRPLVCLDFASGRSPLGLALKYKVVGHSYVVYGPLLAGCASVMFEGKPVGTPDASAYV